MEHILCRSVVCSTFSTEHISDKKKKLKETKLYNIYTCKLEQENIVKLTHFRFYKAITKFSNI